MKIMKQRTGVCYAIVESFERFDNSNDYNEY